MAHNDSGFTVSINRHRVSVMSIAALVQSDESFSNVRLPQYLVNMVTAHHSLDKKKRHTSIDIDATSRFTARGTGNNTSNYSALLQFGRNFAI